MRIEFSAFCGRLMAESRSLLQQKIDNHQKRHMCSTVRFPFAHTSWISRFCLQNPSAIVESQTKHTQSSVLNAVGGCNLQLVVYRKEIFIECAAIPRRIKILTSVYLILSSNACAMWRNNAIKLEHKKRRRMVTNRRPCCIYFVRHLLVVPPVSKLLCSYRSPQWAAYFIESIPK